MSAIKQAIADAGFTQSDVARSLGVTRQAVSRWCRGDRAPDAQTLSALEGLLGVPLDDVATRDPWRPLGAEAQRAQAIEESAHRLACDVLAAEVGREADDPAVVALVRARLGEEPVGVDDVRSWGEDL